MDVMCKCGHNIDVHNDEWGCMADTGKCDCNFDKEDVCQIFITEQQARLDTNRQQNVVMAKKIERLEGEKKELITALSRISLGRGMYDENDMIRIANETVAKVTNV